MFPTYEADAAFVLAPVPPLAVMARINAAIAYLKAPLQAAQVKAVVDWVATTPAYAMTYGALDDALPAVLDLMRR